MNIEIINQKPPEHIYDACVKKFGVDFEKGVIFAYENKIHARYPEQVTEDLKVHESTHFKQHKEFGSSDKWWDKYLEDDAFRLSQELEAYQNQYQFIKANCNRKYRKFMLDKICTDLSSRMYGNLISYKDVQNLLDF